MDFLTALNLHKNELQNAVIQPLGVAPNSPKEGQIYYNSSDKFIYRYDGSNWGPIGVVYNQASTTGVVITGLDSTGKVDTTKVINITLDDYSPVEGGYVAEGMTLEAALVALDTAVKNAVAGGGEVNQNAWSNIIVKKQSDASTAVAGQSADATIAATAKTDTFTLATGNKWIDVNNSGKVITIGHSLSGATAGSYGANNKSAVVTVDVGGHVTNVTESTITPAAIGADVAGAAADVLGSTSDDSTKATVYGARALANEAKNTADGKVASVSATTNGGITIGGTTTAPTVGIKLDTKTGNAATLSADGLMVTIPDVDIPEYTVVKLSAATDGYLASYQLQKDGVGVGEVINIPKDYLVKSAEIKTSTGTSDPSGFPAGTKYIDFTINTYDSESGTGTTSHIYLNVNDLVDVYTAGNGISISDTNVVSAKVVAGNGLSVDATGIKMGAASATSAGAMSSAHYTKLEGIAEGATKNTITLNGATTANPSFYAPTTAGTSGQVLISNGSGQAPTYQDMPEAFHKYIGTNGVLTASGGAFTWTIVAGTHGISNNGIITQLYEVSSGAQVIADVSVNSTNYTITVTINDTENAGTLSAGTYRIVAFG